MSATTAVLNFYTAIGRGDLDAAVDLLTPNARFWNNSDRHQRTVAEMRPAWNHLVASTAERGIADVRVQETAKGCVQQHVFYTRDAAGMGRGLPCCIVVYMDGGLIARIDEYVDLQSAFPIGPDKTVLTPGLS